MDHSSLEEKALRRVVGDASIWLEVCNELSGRREIILFLPNLWHGRENNFSVKS